MSWIKRRGQPSPNPTNPGVQLYNPNQHSTTQQPHQQQWPQQPQQYGTDWYNQSRLSSKTPPAPQQQYSQSNTNNYWQQPSNLPQQHTSNVSNQPAYQYQYNQYPNNQQPNYYQNYESQTYQNQPPNIPQETSHNRNAETDPWNWDWQDNSNANSNSQTSVVNQNNIAESFANDESWNWSIDDTNSSQSASRSDSTHGTPSESTSQMYVKHVPEDEPSGSRTVPASKCVKEEASGKDGPSVENVDKAMKDLTLNAQFENKEIVSPETGTNPIPELTPPPQPTKSSQPDKNPYKRTTTLSHKAVRTLKEPSADSSPVILRTILNYPTPPRPADNLGVNLETLPDNSERPDLPVESVPKSARKTSAVQSQWPENCEVAPINDRNQYLETGQLSDADVPFYNQSRDDHLENTQIAAGDNSDPLPPPGLSRFVLGQMEYSDGNQPVDNVPDEPPPGLSRMVLGGLAGDQSTKKPVNYPIFENEAANYQLNEEPPAGLHRMVPGESSSPESSYLFTTDTVVFQQAKYNDADNYVSETELNQMGVTLVSQRSATIGADTPPTNQQTVLSTGYSSSSSLDPISSREGAVGIDHEADLKPNSDDNTAAALPADNRRETIDGGPQDEVASVQNATNGSQEKHRTRAYTTDSDREQPKERHNRSSSPAGHYDKDRRYYEDRRDRRDRDRDSPDRYRDRRYDRRKGKDRRYEDDTEYYSDKERNDQRRRDNRDEYEKRYSSLRREKDRDRRHDRTDRREYEAGDRRDDYYYNRYEEDYYNRSRPSSRSDSLHDAYRERNHRSHNREHDRNRQQDRDRDRDRDHHRRPRDPYNPYYQGYNYDPYNPYYQQYQYQYYENLRRTNPQAYAEWYRKYYQSQGGTMAHVPGYNTEDRASVHSGRSSANEELNKDRYTRQSYYSQQSLPHYYRDIHNASSVYTADDSRLLDNTDSSLILEDNTISQRLTPTKFPTAHVKASISSRYFVNILPHYPIDGQPAAVEILNLQSLLMDDEDCKELSEFPGPLTKGVTHKKTIIDYCENKIRKAQVNANAIQDVDSYILMWELLILLLRQNGMVVGTDIAELLMKNRTYENSRRPSVSSASSTQHIDSIADYAENTNTSSNYKEEYITDKFREFLIYGSGKEALEWAMKHGLWGHALFLASKLDKRTYANVMMRFANGLTMNDPLQTLYQLLSGRQPAAVTCVAEEKWGDWRPHLAMILSNTSQRPDLDRKAITTLGDTLFARGSLYAAHFCYLMAQVEFGRYGTQNVKLVLLSSSHVKPFSAFATNEAIFMTEIYEYACSLSDAAFTIPEFQPYKYLVATRMVDHGLLEKGLSYLERLAQNIKQDPSRIQQSLISRICELADQLKYCDPMQDDGDLDNSRADTSWLSDLKSVLNDYNMGLIIHQSTTNLTSLEPDVSQDIKQMPVDQLQTQDQVWQQHQTDYYQQQVDQPTWQTDNQTVDYNNQPLSYQEPELQHSNFEPNSYQEQQYWNQQPQQLDAKVENNQQQTDEQLQTNWNWNSAQSEPPQIKKEIKTDQDAPRPQISMPNQSTSKNYFDDAESNEKFNQKPASPLKSKPPIPPKTASTGWFGGIWSKLALRSKNQMKLPDDKNPTIVWDSEKKRWINLEEENGDVTNEIKPPPKMNEMYPNRSPGPPNQSVQQPMSLPANIPMNLPTQNQNNNIQHVEYSVTNTNSQNVAPIANTADNNEGQKPVSAQPNMFKMQRGRNMKKAYVDVFNPGGATSAKSSLPPAEVFNLVPNNESSNKMNFFVPAPVTDLNAPTDFLSAQPTQTEDNTQLSRWSSSSSLSKEVQFYMRRSRVLKNNGTPMMYNPNQFSNQQSSTAAPRGQYQNH